MSEEKKIGRRDMMKMLAALGFGGVATAASAGPGIGAMIPGKGWVKASDTACDMDGTPLQFMPRGKQDEKPLENELEKYPKCPYCGMDRKKFHHSRHLVQYDDNLVDGTCSIHCLAISLSLNLDRGPKKIYAADFGSAAEIKPLVDADQASYLIGGEQKGTMTMKSKMAYSAKDMARRVQGKVGGQIGTFDDALREAYLSMADDTAMIRKKRAEKVKKMMEMNMKKQG